MNRWIPAWWLLAGFLIPAGEASAQLQSLGTQFWHHDSSGVGGSPETNADFGRALTIGDYNCDGLHDAAFGVPRDDQLGGAQDGGQVLVLYAANGGVGLSSAGRQRWSQFSILGSGSPTPFENFGAALASGDFDSDGCDDLVIGVPFDDVEGVNAAGSVHVLYGRAANGLTTLDDDYWHQGPNSAGAGLEAGDQFGRAVAVGDFDGDGFDDLAIGIPGEGIGSGAGEVTDAGAIQVLFGGASGLSTTSGVILRRGTNLFGSPVANEQLGEVLAAGNINASVGDELVIGIPTFRISAALPNAGAIMLLTDIDNFIFDQTFTQDSPDIPGVAEAGDSFGGSLAVGDFDGNGFAEVAVGAIGEDIEGAIPANSVGAINIIDVTAGNHSLWTQGNLPPEQPEAFDNFGSALAAADFNGDNIDDLAIGVSGEDLGSAIPNAGLVHVMRGSSSAGLTTTGRQIWLQTLDPPDPGDRFGSALAAGPINGGAAADLIIGAPTNSISLPQVGSATVLYSRGDELFADGFEEP